MKVTNSKVICKTTSKKGSDLISVYRGADKLVDNCVLVNPCGLNIEINNVVDGDIIFNSNGLNTFIVTSVNK